jgi:YfiH family protein
VSAGPEFLRFDRLGEGVRAVVTTRAGGVSSGPYSSLNLSYQVGDDPAAVAENRKEVCSALGVARLTVADQRHGAKVAVIDEKLAGAGHSSHDEARALLPATDGLVTDRPGVALTIVVADCQPVVVWDPVRRVLGVAHAGRKGTVAGVVPAVIDTLSSAFGSRPGQLRVAVGPCIGAESYEVGPAEAAEVDAAFPDIEVCVPTGEGRVTVDLTAAVRFQLRRAGVADEAVEVAGIDTRRATDRFFSHRAQRPCGRFALIAAIGS